MKRSLLSFLFICAIVSFGCFGEIKRTDIVGNFNANYENAVDTLELKADGTYVHIYKSTLSDDGRTFTNINKWNFEYINGKPKIVFSEFISGIPSQYSGGHQGPGTWVTEAKEPLFGGLRLPIFDDLDLYYEKEE